jgi:hypothetical protein
MVQRIVGLSPSVNGYSISFLFGPSRPRRTACDKLQLGVFSRCCGATGEGLARLLQFGGHHHSGCCPRTGDQAWKRRQRLGFQKRGEWVAH